MRKILIALIIFSLSFGVVGCKSDKEENTTNNSEVVTQEKSNEQKKRSSDEMYDLYTSKLEEVEKFFKENNIDFKEDQSNKNKKYDGTVSISYENSDDNAKYSVAGYGIAFNSDGEIKSISAGITLNVIDEEMKTKKFKFEDTEFYKLHNILISDINNTDEINNKVNEAYKGLTSLDKVEIENGKIKESLLLGDNRLVYTIIINP
ncbi:MAG: hypothetical protein SPH93_15860 [Clostridium sp.]|uniref:hypothetical protein n=1 Tax=Clostridium sp. TaxID=1506 RepID=UPI002A8289F6|nr:hypothetical protein [Clostridium sp.]MDY4253013.1 hypothetical protein [Clostridium sp.]MDY6229107.1 hypothetical protein [Clostridium sp.]